MQVGGSAGQVSKAIAVSAPRLRFIVQDLDSMVSIGEQELEPDFQGRFTFQRHNFFDPNPVDEPPGAFLLRFILHDWPDQDAVNILRQLTPKMGPETRLLINDSIVPPPGSVPPLQEKYIRNMDLIMLSMFNALERSLEDWERLISKADPSLKIVRVERPQGSAISMIQVAKSEG